MMAFSIVVAVATLAAAQSQTVDPRAIEVLERTKTTDATYAVYSRMHVSNPGQNSFSEWAAEFHQGELHRFESASYRMVADCRERSGHYLSIRTGETSSGSWVAAAACGINTAKPLKSATYVGKFDTRFGFVDRIQVSDEDNLRVYDVLPNGALLNVTYSDPSGKRVFVHQEGINVAAELPSSISFEPNTLSNEYAPEPYRR